MTDYPVVIIGSGCAGLSAAIYAGRGGNDPLVLQGDEPGGQLTLTTDVANYPGFPDGLGGSDLINRMKEQATQFGATVENGIVTEITEEENVFTITTNTDTYTTESVIVASGASARMLDINGEDELLGYGVSTCATCDGAFFKDEEMAVVGGGDAACEEAVFLTKFASKVHLLHRRENFRAEEYWVDEVKEHVESGDIEIHRNTEVTDVIGSKEDGVSHIKTVYHADGHPKEKLRQDEYDVTEDTLDVGAMFIAIGHVPNTQFLDNTAVELDAEGYILLEDGEASTETHHKGIFAAGDVYDKKYQQAATAVGSGVKAAMDVDEYLS